MITIGQLARTYCMLPSEVAARASTFDIMVNDVYTTWENYQKDPNNTSHYKQEDLKALVERNKK